MRLFSLCLSLLLLSSGCRGAQNDEDGPAPTSSPTTTADAGAALFSDEQNAAISSSGKSHKFEAEVNRLMEIIIHWLYTNRDIVFRELVSNSNDALKKTRYQLIQSEDGRQQLDDLKISIKVNKNASMISISDTGIGMTKGELEENLGTVAKSGTAKFLDAFAEGGGDAQKALNLVGQFGVGFYSAFLVSDEVTVVSKSDQDPKQHVWRSKADGSFIIAEDPRGVTMKRGTEVILHVKEDAKDFLENFKVEETVKRYSQFIEFPIRLWDSKTESREVPDESAETTKKDKEDTTKDGELETEDEDEEDDKPKTKTVEETVWYWKVINENKPLWTRRPDSVNASEYKEFYKAFSGGADEPIKWAHFRAEGEIEFDALLFVPNKAPWGMYDNYYTQKSEMKLYVRRVLVADKFEDFMPRYLNFIKGLVDSNDLPLVVNREQLQKHKIMTVISKKLSRKALTMLRKMSDDEGQVEDEDEDESTSDDDKDKEKEAEKDKAKDKGPKKPSADTDYQKFWKEFGKSVKLGVIEDFKNRKRLVELLRFPSSFSADVPVSLASYEKRMKKGQKNIYYITAASLEEAQKSPFLEPVVKRGFEVLFWIDNLDNYLNLNEYGDYSLMSITKEGLDLGEGKKATKYKEDKETEFKPLVEYLKDLYGSRVSKIQLSTRLEESPMMVVTSKHGTSATMERIQRAQAFGQSGGANRAERILELNFRHPIVKQMKELAEADTDKSNTELRRNANLLLDMALVQSGFPLEADDITKLSGRVTKLVSGGLGVPADATVEAMPVFEEDPTDDDDDEDEDEDEDDEDEEADEAELSDDKPAKPADDSTDKSDL